MTNYGTTRNPFRLYAIGFGPVFQGPNASAALRPCNHAILRGHPEQSSTALSSNQIITGTDTQMSANMINAFTTILENGVQIALYQMTMPNLVAEFIDVVKTYQHRSSRPDGPGLAWSQLGNRTR